MQERLENTIAIVCCATVGLMGILLNGVCIVLLVQIGTFKTAFGYLTLFHTTANALLISSYLFWVAPYIFWDFQMFMVNRTVGQITIIAQAASYFSMLLLSTNRFVCIFKPTRYVVLFRNHNTFMYIIATTLVCLAYGCVYFYPSCYFAFDRSTLEFMFSSTACGDFLSEYIDFWMSIVLMVCTAFLDVITLVKLRLVIWQGHVQLKYGSSARFKKDLRFLAQTVCTTMLFSTTIICFHTISPLFTERFARFCATTLIWGVNHTGAGVIIIAFNKPIRSNIHRPFWPRVSSAILKQQQTRIVVHSRV